MTYDPVKEEERLKVASANYKYDPDHYQFEKIIGKRSLTGELKLKRLSGIHRRIIGYHLRCLSNCDISLVTGMSENAISRILRDPLSQTYIKENIAASDAELEALAPLATDAVRKGLSSDNPKTALAAADRFFRATGRYNTEPGAGNKDTAEDVIARAVTILAETQAGILNTLTRPNRPKAIDVDFERVENGDDSNSESKTVARLPSVDVGDANGD